jgi:NAD(P)H-hydrate epimerase
MTALSLRVLRQLHQPKRGSHKGDNGVLYMAAGSKQYHGALQYAVTAASYFVDLIYVETDSSNTILLRALKTVHPAIIHVAAAQRSRYLRRSACLLLGPGLGRSAKAQQLTCRLLSHPQRPAMTVIDADALHYLRPNDLTAQTIITPHPGEYRAIFGLISPAALSRQMPAVVLAKGERAQICQNGKCQYNTTGIACFTKGGVGDVLAGLTAAFVTTNAPLLAAQAASVLLGRSALDLQRRCGANFSTLQLAEQLPLTLHHFNQRRSSTRHDRQTRR